MNWGKIILLDLHGCNENYIKDEKVIEKFVIELCDKINMKRHGPVRVERFGEGGLEGYSAFQFIETSSVTLHFDEGENRAFIDVFSCKDFDEKLVEEFAKDFFEASDSEGKCFLRK